MTNATTKTDMGTQIEGLGAATETVEWMANKLSEGVGADIWFDAADHNDEGAADRIETVQAAMTNAASLLPGTFDAMAKLYVLASSLVEKAGINAADLMSDEEHKLWQDASGTAAAALKAVGWPAIGWQIVRADGTSVHGDDDDPFGLMSFSVLRGEAVDAASAWVDENEGYAIKPVNPGDIENPEFVTAVSPVAGVKP